MLLMCLIAHWTACVWHLLIVYNPDKEFSIVRSGDLVDEYLACFYGAFLLMVGDQVDARNNLETVFCWCVLLLGTFCCTTKLPALPSRARHVLTLVFK
jgi:hypothetical protein